MTNNFLITVIEDLYEGSYYWRWELTPEGWSEPIAAGYAKTEKQARILVKHIRDLLLKMGTCT